MNFNLRAISAGVLFFIGAGLHAQTTPKKDTSKVSTIEEVVVVGYQTRTKSKAMTSTAKVSSETLNNRPNSNVLNVAQGQLAGVNIATGTGQPGATPTVVIRGKGSLLGNNDPLYVIDGFPGTSASFRNIDPNDIESMEVLKDAFALSQYGNRGAAGVIIVKTKKGRFNAPMRFNYKTQYGVSTMQDHGYNLASAKELLRLERMYGKGRGVGMTDEQIDNYAIDTDWLDYFFQPSTLQSHNFSMSVGGSNMNNYTNFGYLDQAGLLKTTDMKRFNVRNNFSARDNSERFNFSLGTALSLTRNRQAASLNTGGVNQNLALGAMKSAPYISPDQYQSPEQLYEMYKANQTLLYTPLFLIDKEKTYRNSTDELRLDVMAEASYKLTEPLTARLRVNGTLRNLNDLSWQKPSAFNSYLFQATGQEFVGTETMASQRIFTFNNLAQLEYVKDFGASTINLSGAFEFNNNMSQLNSQTQNGLNPRTWVPGTGTGYIVSTNDFYLPRVAGAQARHNLFSFFGVADYDFNSKYGIGATIRRDASSRFAADYRWGTFWSVGARWNINKESFMDDVNWINVLKLRGSYGTVGNERILPGIFDALNPPAYLNSYLVSSTPQYNAQIGLLPSLGYEQLQWETTKNLSVGVDFEVFEKRLRGAFDYYDKRAENTFYPWPQSPIFGQTALNMNSPIDTRNSGFELDLTLDLIKNADRNIGLTLRGNGAINKEQVYNIPEDPLVVGSNTKVISTNGGLWEAPYAYHYLGVNPNNGNLLFEDANGNPTENPTDADRKQLKYNFRNPKYTGGFGLDLNIGGFFVNATFNYVAGIYRYDYDMLGYQSPTDIGVFNVSKDLLNAWTPTNTSSNVPSLTAQNRNYQDGSDRFLVEASYLRLRNLQVGFDIPKNVLSGTFVRNMTVMLQGENLVHFSKWKGFDPESTRSADQYGYPTPRIITLGLDVQF